MPKIFIMHDAAILQIYSSEWFSMEVLWGHHCNNNNYNIQLEFSGERFKMLEILNITGCFTHEEMSLIQHDFPISYQTCSKNLFSSYLSPEIHQ